jgi:hypothetical protein
VDSLDNVSTFRCLVAHSQTVLRGPLYPVYAEGTVGTKLGPKKAVLRGGFFHGFFFFLPLSSIIRDLFLEWHP